VFKALALAPAAGILLLVVGCSAPQLTPDQVMALRQAQTRSFEVPVDTVFKATMTYLQDNHYQIKQASKDTGLINAIKSVDVSGGQKFFGALFAGNDAKRGDNYEVTFTLEAMDAVNSKVRCNITHGVSNLAGGTADINPVTDLAAYKGLLDGLNTEVQRKHMTTTLQGAK
jgi:hypothetical protein